MQKDTASIRTMSCCDAHKAKYLVNLLEHYLENPFKPAVIINACAVLCTFTTVEVNQATFGELGGVTVLNNVIKRHIEASGNPVEISVKLLTYVCNLMCHVQIKGQSGQVSCGGWCRNYGDLDQKVSQRTSLPA